MKKLTALLVAMLFSLSTAMPVSAAPVDEGLAMVPATKAVKSAKKHRKSVKHKSIKKAKHKNIRKAKPRHAKARTYMRLRRH